MSNSESKCTQASLDPTRLDPQLLVLRRSGRLNPCKGKRCSPQFASRTTMQHRSCAKQSFSPQSVLRPRAPAPCSHPRSGTFSFPRRTSAEACRNSSLDGRSDLALPRFSPFFQTAQDTWRLDVDGRRRPREAQGRVPQVRRGRRIT